ncbi:MAG: hypothetical protein RLZZ210_755 [Pseudomonadota bacterium]|jgi:hypothetical protein
MAIKLNRNGYLIDDNRLLCNHKHSASARKDNSNCDKLALYKLKLSFNRADRTYDVLSSNRNASTQEKFQINQTQFADALSNFIKSLETHGSDGLTISRSELEGMGSWCI